MASHKVFKLNTGATIPGIALGTWCPEPVEMGGAIKTAIRCGYRHLDCAHIYENEKQIGPALAEVLKEQGLKREDIFVTSKLWNNSHAKEDVMEACKKSLKDLQLDYLDLYLVHHPTTFPKDLDCVPPGDSQRSRYLLYDKTRMSETWKGMEEVYKKGLCKAIGVSNFTTVKIKNLLETAEVKPAVNQVERHPYLPQPELKKLCEEKGILITAYSPLGSPGRPDVLVDVNEPIMLEDPLIKDIARKRSCTPAQVLIAWSLNTDCPVLPKSFNEKRIKENIGSCDVKLQDEDLEALAKIGKKFRYFNMRFMYAENVTDEIYWDGEQ